MYLENKAVRNFHGESVGVLGDNAIEENAIWDTAKQAKFPIKARERRDRLHVEDVTSNAQIDFMRNNNFVPIIPTASSEQAIKAAHALNQIKNGNFVSGILGLATISF
jgi:hypothetical protein